jgi:hypothetical protein
MPRYVALRKALGRGVLAAAILAAIAYLAAAPGHPAQAQTAAGPASEEELDVVAFSGFQLRFEELNQRVGQAIGGPPFRIRRGPGRPGRPGDREPVLAGERAAPEDAERHDAA